MKSFAEWQSSKANSIEDKSMFIKPCSCGNPIKPINTQQQTALQIRAALASLVVPYLVNEDSVQDWLTIFCVSLDNEPKGSRSVSEQHPRAVIGTALATEYAFTHGDDASVRWVHKLIDGINDGSII